MLLQIKGAPQFMLGMAQGRTRPPLHLYDIGYSSVLFKSGVPKKELNGCVMKTKGPFFVGGVGGTSVKVNDEFMVTVSLTDGTLQIMEGWTIDRITDALPFVDLRQAEKDLKSSDPDNEELQQLQCPPQIGGEVDVLMGILYSNIFPRPVHSLSNGLTIYEMRVTPHDPHHNAVIGDLIHPSDLWLRRLEELLYSLLIFRSNWKIIKTMVHLKLVKP